MAFTTTTAANGVITLTGTNGIESQTLINVGIGAPGVEVIALGSDDVIDVDNFTNSATNWTIKGGISADEAEADNLSDNDSLLENTGLFFQSSFIAGNAGDDDIGNDGLSLGSSTLQGGQGDDDIIVGTITSSLVNGNKGDDDVDTTSNISNSSVFGGQGRDVIRVQGGFGDYSITNSLIDGSLGADRITVGDANEDGTVPAGAGPKSLLGTSITGGAGNDVITINVGVENGIKDSDTNTEANPFITKVAAFVQGGDLDDEITGGGGNDSLEGGTGNDKIFGRDGQDLILAGEGNDQLTGGLKADVMTGGAGDDQFFIDGEGAAAATFTGLLIDGKIDVITDFSGGTKQDEGDKFYNGSTLFAAADVAENQGADFKALLASAKVFNGEVEMGAYGTNQRFTAVLLFGGDTKISGAIQVGSIGQFASAADAINSIERIDFVNPAVD